MKTIWKITKTLLKIVGIFVFLGFVNVELPKFGIGEGLGQMERVILVFIVPGTIIWLLLRWFSKMQERRIKKKLYPEGEVQTIDVKWDTQK